MPCTKLTDGSKIGFICGPSVYNFKGYLFEWIDNWGPVPLKKDGSPRQRVQAGFWDAVIYFGSLNSEQKLKYRVHDWSI